MGSAKIEQILLNLVKDYQELNGGSVPESSQIPSAVDLFRAASVNRPLVMRGAGQELKIPALSVWSDSYLIDRMKDVELEVAVTPFGNADSIVDDTYFVEPASTRMTLADLLTKLDESADGNIPVGPAYYLQSQNGNLSSGEMMSLLEDVGEAPEVVRQVFGDKADVANIWIGDSKSVTSLHKDPYENIFFVIRGSKTFSLMPPTEYICLHEKHYPTAKYLQTGANTFDIVPNDSQDTIPWIPVDPVKPDYTSFPRFKHARPLEVTLEKGDMLYLPSLWYHRVAQQGGPGPDGRPSGSAIAVNWWFDMRMDGPAWATATLLRDLADCLGKDNELF